MNRIKFILCAILLGLFSASSIAQQTPSGPVIQFDKLVHDYGTIYQNDNGMCSFKFTNKGDEPLILSNVKSSCGCTIPKWPKDPILPGQSSAIDVSYDTKRIGTISKQITVMSNATESTVILSIKGNILQKPTEVLPEKQVNDGFTPTAN